MNNKLQWLSQQINRSKGQTEMLLGLVDNDFEKLKALEVQIKNCFVMYCPSNKKEVEKIMNMQPKSNYFKLLNNE